MSELETALERLSGTELGFSEWIEIDQERIDRFAEATGDHQWIHVDIARARRELPSRSTIAHGFLTLSLLPIMMGEVIQLPGVALSLNYGLNKVRFLNPVPAGSRVRAQVSLLGWEAGARGYLCRWQVTVELEGADKPACVAENVFRYYE
jgi:acyl dehydratase